MSGYKFYTELSYVDSTNRNALKMNSLSKYIKIFKLTILKIYITNLNLINLIYCNYNLFPNQN